MILTDQNIDINLDVFNPSITLYENSRICKYSFPDPNSFFILSEAGRNYSIIENTTILLNLNKGYFQQNFHVNNIKTSVLSISNRMFSNSEPINGLARVALEMAILKAGKRDPSLKNRL